MQRTAHVHRGSAVGWAGRAAAWLLPGTLFLLGAVQAGGTGPTAVLLGLGAAFHLLVGAVGLANAWIGEASSGPSMELAYLSGWVWFFLPFVSASAHAVAARSALALTGSSVLGVHLLRASGAPYARRVRRLMDRIARVPNWPADLRQIRALPIVEEFREALEGNAEPALVLADQPRTELACVALAALEGWRAWRPAEAEFVLSLAQRTEDANVRIAALKALTPAKQRPTAEGVAEFLLDPSPAVRQAAEAALAPELAIVWPWIRNTIRQTLSEPSLAEDRALFAEGATLGRDAVRDLSAWTGEKGTLGSRAAASLAAHFRAVLAEGPDEEVVEELRRQLLDVHTPAAWRLELAPLLESRRLLGYEDHEWLLDPGNPAPLRLIAAEALLAAGDHPGAVAALRDIARLPNRDMSLATAALVQRCLGVDLGLTPGEPPPPAQTRQAAEVTRRVMRWAADYGQHEPEDDLWAVR